MGCQVGKKHLLFTYMAIIRGNYDYCRVPGTWQLSPLEVGEDNSNIEPKKLRKIQIHQYGQRKGCYRGF